MGLLRVLLIIGCGIWVGVSLAKSFPKIFLELSYVIPNMDVGNSKYSFEIVMAMGFLGFILGASLGNILLKVIDKGIDNWERSDSGEKVNLLFSIIAGIIFGGIILSIPFVSIVLDYMIFISPFVSIGAMIAVGMMTYYALESMGDILPWMKNRPKFRRKNLKILDTNVIIDGRIYEIIKSGFLEGNLYIPSFVLDELQYIADSQDPLRRQRGRRGLEILRLLQSEFALEIGVYDKLIKNESEVDKKLVKLAVETGGDIVTNDFNLNRVALLQEVKVLNINELALGLKPTVLPREIISVIPVREGNHQGQGVAYLDDGTMVVIENGSKYLNQTIEVMAAQVIQSERGRMIFGDLTDNNQQDNNSQNLRKKKNAEVIKTM